MSRISLLFTFLATVSLFSCKQSPFEITGNISDAGELSVYFDQVEPLQSSNSIVARGTADSNGKFSIPMEVAPEAGLYRLRVGAKSIYLPLDGSEKNINLSGSLKDVSTFNYSISGAALAEDYATQMNKRVTGQTDSKGLSEYLSSTANPLVGVLIASQLYRSPTDAPLHSMVSDKLSNS